MRLKLICLPLIIGFTLQSVHGQIGRLALSPVQKVEQVIGLTTIDIVYSRPSMRGRKIFGGLVPYNEFWRTGANRNTTIQFSEDVIVGQTRIKEGKYGIITKPGLKQWEFILYKDTDNWNVPDTIDQKKIAVSMLVDAHYDQKKREVLDISIGDFTNYGFELDMAWENAIVSIPIGLITKEVMDAKIDRILSGPGYNDFYAAAVYQMESGKEFEKGLASINRAMEVTEKVTWWDLRVKAKLLYELGKFEEALKIAQVGLAAAKNEKRAYGINEFENLIKRIPK